MDLLVHPKSVWLLVYPGGYCGEFIAWWLGLHPGCIHTGTRNVGKNRYVGQHKFNYVYSDAGCKDFLFLTAHPSSVASKAGLVVSDPTQHIQLYAGKRTDRFYFLLYLVKTVFYKHTTLNPPFSVFPSVTHWNRFVQYLNGRTQFTSKEVECWLDNVPYRSADEIVRSAWNSSKTWASLEIQPQDINLDELFFGDYTQCYMSICDRLNLQPDSNLDHYIPEYHRRNIALVEKYTGMDLDQFLELDDSRALTVVSQSMINCEKESHIFV